MPSSSAKQAKFMRAIAHSPSFAKKVGVKQSVGKDFEMADKKVKKFGSGGITKDMPTADAMGDMNMAKGGSAKSKSKAKAKGKAMMAAAMMKDRIGRALAARGAETPMAPAPSAPMDSMPPAAPAPAGPPMGGAPGMKKGGKTKMAKGGGIERKGKTNTKMVKMAKGGAIDGIAQRGKTRCSGAK
jgi:hypothetical protein